MHAPAYDSDGITEVGPEHTRFAGRYRDDLPRHPGCLPRASYDGALFLNRGNQAEVPPGLPVQSVDPQSPAYLIDYPCAAKAYQMPTGTAVDPAKPVVILVHGGMASPNSWEEFVDPALIDVNPDLAGTQLRSANSFEFTADSAPREMFAHKLLTQGFQVYAADFRSDRVRELVGANPDASTDDPGFGDGFGSVDHGWSVPLVQALIKAVMLTHTRQQIALVGHGLGATVARDALRRLYKEFRDGRSTLNPYPRVNHVVLASGFFHGLAGATYCCTNFATMLGTRGCELGDLHASAPTPFMMTLNGPEDLFSVPCADGYSAYGDENACDGHTVLYTTLGMTDIGDQTQDEEGNQQTTRLNVDRYTIGPNGQLSVTEANCVDNRVLSLADFDSSGYFFEVHPGYLANHFGSIRSDEGMALILARLSYYVSYGFGPNLPD